MNDKTHCNTLQHTATHRNTLQHTVRETVSALDSKAQSGMHDIDSKALLLASQLQALDVRCVSIYILT